MKKRFLKMVAVTIFCLLVQFGCALEKGGWHQLYVPGDGYWKKRIGIDIVNLASYELLGEPVVLKVGKKMVQQVHHGEQSRTKEEIDLIGAEAREIRVCDYEGNEFLFNIIDTKGKQLQEGKIPEGAQIIFPVEVKADEGKRYYIYFDNPSAWPVPEFFSATTGTFNTGFEEEGWWEWKSAQRSLDKFHSGKASAKLVADGNNVSGPSTPMLPVPQDASVCKISLYYNLEITDGIYWISIDHYDRSGKPIPRTPGRPESHTNIFSIKVSSDGWKNFTYTFGQKDSGAQFILPEGTSKIKIRGDFWDADGSCKGVCWLDDFVLEGLDKSISIVKTKINPAEELKLKVVGESTKWLKDGGFNWEFRIPVEIANYTNEQLKNVLTGASLAKVKVKMKNRFNESSIRVVNPEGKIIPHFVMDEKILFAGNAGPLSIAKYFVYLSGDSKIKPGALSSYADLISGEVNLVQNPDFENAKELPEGWETMLETGKEDDKIISSTQDKNVKYEWFSPGKIGKHCVKMEVSQDASSSWRGWHQEVPVKPNANYFYGGYVKVENARDGNVSLHGHFHDTEGKLCGQKYFSAGGNLTGTQDWTLLSTIIKTPADAASVILYLTTNAKGTVWHDGVLFCDAVDVIAKDIQYSAPSQSGDFLAWDVNPIVKVFQNDIPPQDLPKEFRIFCARNEKEPLQIALRSTKDLEDVVVKLIPFPGGWVPNLTNATGEKLEDIKIERVGYVPVDYPSNFFSSDLPSYRRIIPSGKPHCEGWAGWWPDPLLPGKPFDLKANITQPVWITVGIPKSAKPGDYAGNIQIESGGKVLKTIPFKVTVWNFKLSDESHLKAIFDLRHGPGWNFLNDQTRPQWYKFMAEHRVCPDVILPSPVIKYKDGTVTLDTTEFDKVAKYCFEELKMAHSYLPLEFYCFGWGFLPKKFQGFEYPTKEYKDAYQKCLKAVWEHLKQKGWSDKFVLYISDEPHAEPYSSDKEVGKRAVEQMQTLCDMIHEAVPEIKIYSSTWVYVPGFDGYLDVWGIGANGRFPVEEMEKRQKNKNILWFTTDGTFILDTPYCAIERLYPYYCFKYNAVAFEHWAVSWWTFNNFNPFEFGWYAYIPHTFKPGDTPKGIRYPNGSGHFTYPGWLIGEKGPLSSVRFEQVREGMEDYEYFYILKERIESAKKKGKDTTLAEKSLEKVKEIVPIPNAGGTMSTQILPDPDIIFATRKAMAEEIVKLGE